MIGLLANRRHGRLRTLLSAYIDGQVSESEASRMEQHLGRCDECRLELDSLRMTVGLLRDLPRLEVPRAFNLVVAPSPATYNRPVAWGAGLATSVAAFLLVALLMLDVFDIVAQSEVLDETASQAVLTEAAVTAPESAAPALAAEVPPAEDEASAESALPPAAAVPAPAGAAAAAPQAAMAAPEPEQLETAPETMMQAAAAPGPPEEVATVEEEVAEGAEPVEETAALATATPAIQSEEGQKSRPPPSQGLSAPLWQLEAAIGGLVAALALATLWIIRRARRPTR